MAVSHGRYAAWRKIERENKMWISKHTYTIKGTTGRIEETTAGGSYYIRTKKNMILVPKDYADEQKKIEEKFAVALGRKPVFGDADMGQLNLRLPTATIDKIKKEAKKQNITVPVLFYNWIEEVKI